MPKTRNSSPPNVRDVPSTPPIASRFVRALLTRHALPSNQHVTKIAELLSIGYSLAYRRITGAVAWELEEIQALARHYGETLSSVFAEQRELLAIAKAVKSPASEI